MTTTKRRRCPKHHYLSGCCCQRNAGHDGPCIAEANIGKAIHPPGVVLLGYFADVIDGSEQANDKMLAQYRNAGGDLLNSVPVWHLHESFGRLRYLCRAYPRVALGSSGEWSDVGTEGWWQRMGEAMDFLCDEDGRPPCKLHGLRMLNPTVFSQLPLASADSTNVAQNHARERRLYQLTPAMAGLKIVDRIEQHACAPRWNRTYGTQFNMDLVG